MEKKNKNFIFPEALIVSFTDEDIITSSSDVGLWYGEKEGDEFFDA